MENDLNVPNLTSESDPDSLAPGSEVHGYRIERMLAKGDYWFRYSAYDLNLGRSVIIIEYMPCQIAIRDLQGAIQLSSAETGAEYKAGLDSFRADTHALAKVSHPSVSQLLHAFELSNSAYIVFAHEQGKTLEEILEGPGLAEQELLALVLPILDGLEAVHASGFIHRYIQPSNILVRPDGIAVLTGFVPGGGALFRPGSTLAKHFPPRFAPMELCYGDGELQGPWTDIYSLGATLYRAVSGVAPVDARERSHKVVNVGIDPLIPVQNVAHDGYSEAFLKAIDHALGFLPTQRPLSFGAWRSELSAPDAVEMVPTSRRAAVSGAGNGRYGGAASEGAAGPADVSLESTIANDRARIPVAPSAPTGGDPPLQGQVQHRRRRRWVAYLVSITGILGLALFLWWMPPASVATLHAAAQAWLHQTLSRERATEAMREPAPQAAAREHQAPDSAAQLREDPARERRTLVETNLDQQIQSLLDAARVDLDADRLTHPLGSNAVDKYRAVLALKPDVEEARQGLQAIAARLVGTAWQAIDREEWDIAQSRLDEAAGIVPGAEAVASLREELKARQSAAVQQRLVEEGKRLQAEEVVNELIALGRRALDANDVKTAEAHWAQAAAILPESGQGTKLRQDLEEHKARAREEQKQRVAERAASEDERTLQKLLELARKAISEQDPQTAAVYVGQAAAIRPDSRDVASVRDSLAQHRAARAPSTVDSTSGVEQPTPEAERPGARIQLTIREASPSRSRVSPGETLRFYTQYSLALPESEKDAYVRATWVLMRNGRKVGQEGVASSFAKPGLNTAATVLTLPPWTASGTFTVEHRVQAGDSVDVARSRFVVSR